MDASLVYIFAIVFLVLALNLFFVTKRIRGEKKQKRMYKIAPMEREQSIWREKEIARRLERENETALERVKLRNDTLALYDEVRRRAAAREFEGALISSKDWNSMENADVERFR